MYAIPDIPGKTWYHYIGLKTRTLKCCSEPFYEKRVFRLVHNKLSFCVGGRSCNDAYFFRVRGAICH